MKALIWVAAVLAVTSPTHAETVAIPYGDMVTSALPFMGWLLTFVAAYALRHLPAVVVSILRTAQVEQMIPRAIDFGINAVAGAVKDKVLTAEIGNAVIAQALNYIVKWAPKALITWMGGEDGIRAKIIARLDLHPDVSVMPAGSVLTQAKPAA